MARGLFGKESVGAVAIVEPPVSQWYARRARVTAVVAGLVTDVLVTSVLTAFCSLLLAVALGALVGVLAAVVTALLVRAWPVLQRLWWWSIEITVSVLVLGVWVWLAHVTTWWIASSTLLLSATVISVFGRSRRLVGAVARCLVVRHRLRAFFAATVRGSGSAGSRPAMVPLMLWARPTPAGERVWVWLRTGLSLADLEGKDGRIAVACIARQVRTVAASERYAALLRVDVTHRDPLTGRIDSPLALRIPSLRGKNADVPVSPAVPPVGLDLADVPEPPAEQPRGGRR